MAYKFIIRANDTGQMRHIRAIEGQAQAITVDFAPWAEDNGALTAANWSVIAGNAAISGAALASSVSTMTLTTTDTGGSIIEVKGSNANYVEPIRFRVMARDPQSHVTNWDYGRRV